MHCASGDRSSSRLRSLLAAYPGENRSGVGDNGAVRQLERRQLCPARGYTELVARAFSQERQRAAVACNDSFVLDACRAERLLHAATWMHPWPAIISMANE